MKRKLFAQLDKIADDHVVLSSSSSCLLPSKLFAGLAHVKQCLVAHPVSMSSLETQQVSFGVSRSNSSR